LLESIDEVGDKDEQEAEGINWLDVACITTIEGREVENEVMKGNGQKLGTVLRPEAPIFVPQACWPMRAESLNDENLGCEVGLVPTDNAVLCSDSESSEERPTELFARSTRTMPFQNVDGSIESGMTGKNGVENLCEEQRKDAELREVIRWLEEPDDQPTNAVLRPYSPEIQQLWAQRQSLQIRAGILYRKFLRADGSLRYWQIVVPRSLKMSFLDAVHAGIINGHPGVEWTRLRLQEIDIGEAGQQTLRCMCNAVMFALCIDQGRAKSRVTCSVAWHVM